MPRPRASDVTSQTPGAAWWFPAVVCLVAVGAYLTALPNGFVWDDENLIVANPLIKSWSFLPRLLTSPLQPNEFTRAIELEPNGWQTADAYNSRGIVYAPRQVTVRPAPARGAGERAARRGHSPP